MFTRIRILAATLVAMSFVACGGGGDPTPTQPPVVPPPVVSAKITSFVVQPSLNPNLSPFTALTIHVSAVDGAGNSIDASCSVDGKSAQCEVQLMQAPGMHTVCATAAGVITPSCQQVPLALPAKSGKVAVVDSVGNITYPSGVPISFGTINGTENVTTGVSGTFTYSSPFAGTDGLMVSIEPTATAKGWKGRSIPEFWATPNPVIGPKYIMTPSCASAGPSVKVPIDLIEAYTLATENSPTGPSSFFQRNGSAGTPQWYHVGNWKLPIKVAFDSVVSPMDSVKFWFYADSINRAFCKTIIVPANKADVDKDNRSSTTTQGILVHFIVHSLATAGVRSNGRDFEHGDMFVDVTTESPSAQANICHEFFHVLWDVGHADAPSIMEPSTRAGNAIQKKDIALVLWMFYMADAERANNSRFSAAQTYVWEVLNVTNSTGHSIYDEPLVLYIDALGKTGSSWPALKSN